MPHAFDGACPMTLLIWSQRQIYGNLFRVARCALAEENLRALHPWCVMPSSRASDPGSVK